MEFLNITLANQVELQFKLLDTPIAKAWIERMQSRETYPLDDPQRFYGFNTPEEEARHAQKFIVECIDTINSHEPIIDQNDDDIWDQDYLNYLHNIFEQYHGLLDQQDHDYWQSAPDEVRKALANLNIAVHRCESVTYNSPPRFVCTWFGLPKTRRLNKADMKQHGRLDPGFGSVCVNYAEIGKTLEDLANDDDKYIADNAFQPFSHVSADFVVRFFDESPVKISQRTTRMKNYYLQNRNFFFKRGYTLFDDADLLPLRFPVAQLVETMSREELLTQIKNNQCISQVSLT
jgi:hypothetical protein